MNIGKPEFLLLLTIHRKLGPIIRPIVAIRENSRFELQENISSLNIDRYKELFSSDALEIIALHEEFSDQNLTRRFSPRNTSVHEFLKQLDEPIFSNHVRPLIDSKVSAILHISSRLGILIFLDEGSPFFFPENQIHIENNPVETWYHFSKTDSGSTYVLEVKTDLQSLRLNDPKNIVVAMSPCWFLSGMRLYHFSDSFNGKRLKPFLTKELIQIPLSAEKKYFETFIAKDLKSGNVTAEGFEVSDLKIIPVMELSLEEDWQGRAVFIIRFIYGDKSIIPGKKLKVFTDLKISSGQYYFTRVSRDQEREQQMIKSLTDNELILLNDNTLSVGIKEHDHISSLYHMISWINNHSSLILEIPVTIIQRIRNSSFFLGPIGLEIDINYDRDWFDITAIISFGEFNIPFIRLKDYILNDIHTFILPNGETAILPQEWFEKSRNIFLFGQEQNGNLRLHQRYFTVAQEMLSMSGRYSQDRFSSFDISQIQLTIPSELKATLREYQVEGLHWMQFLKKHQFGGCLADDMGLGKTIQTIAMLLSLNENERGPSLIIMQASLIHNWKRELEKFAPSLSVLIHAGTTRPRSTQFFDSFNIILTTYGTIRNDIEMVTGFTFSYVILDESQVIKNPEALITNAVQRLKSRNRLVLTGTPIENSITDLWSQMQFLNPGMLGDLRSFQKEYLNLDTNEDENPRIKRLQRLIRPFLLRRTKPEVEPELPPLTQEIIFCEMTGAHQHVYEIERSAIRHQILENLNVMNALYDSISVLKSLLRLRQLANHPVLVNQEYLGDSGKFDEITNYLEILAGEKQKVLVFSSFVKHLQLFATHLDKKGQKYVMLTGSTTNRPDVVDRFQNDPDTLVFLISLKAGGTGLNLTEAGYVFILDPWWNPAAELQAINRAHRIGQNKKVIAYRFICKNTIEEKIIKMQERKQMLSETFVKSGNPLKGLTKEEVMDLFE